MERFAGGVPTPQHPAFVQSLAWPTKAAAKGLLTSQRLDLPPNERPPKEFQKKSKKSIYQKIILYIFLLLFFFCSGSNEVAKTFSECLPLKAVS